MNDNLGATLGSIVGRLGASALLARESFVNGIQGPLLSNQWQLEVERFQAIIMALNQRLVVEQATGPTDSQMRKFVEKPSSKEGRWLCKNQVS